MILIRHARAGHRYNWAGDDRRRPLDARGRRQAEELVELLADLEIERILSSPYDRCVATMEPLARSRLLAVELREELGEELQSTDGVRLIRSLEGTPVVACVHGGLSELLTGKSLKKGETLML